VSVVPVEPLRLRDDLSALVPLQIVIWQIPGVFLATGVRSTTPQTQILAHLRHNGQLSVGQAMAVIIISRFVIMIWSFVIAWVGLTFHIGYTVQNRYSWGGCIYTRHKFPACNANRIVGMRGAYLPLLQRGMGEYF
jgi:cytosine/uracil/thiamine/allantoin permease